MYREYQLHEIRAFEFDRAKIPVASRDFKAELKCLWLNFVKNAQKSIYLKLPTVYRSWVFVSDNI